MKLKRFGIVVFLGLSLTGCSGAIATDDLTNCRDAKAGLKVYFETNAFNPASQELDLNMDFERKLALIADRTSSQDLSEAIVSDINKLKTGRVVGLIEFTFTKICSDLYGDKFFRE
jgi:hypothetical protein